MLKELQDNFVLRMAAIEDETAEMNNEEVDYDSNTAPAESAQDNFGQLSS